MKNKNAIQRFYLFILLLFAVIAPTLSEAASYHDRCVILLHGLARSHYAMTALASTLTSNGYIVINQNYPTTSEPVEELSKKYIPLMVNMCLQYKPKEIDFVTHSLGGIVLQDYLQYHDIPKLVHIVMLGPPNHGSPLADIFHNNWLFQFFTGPAGQELTTDKKSIPNTLHRNHKYIVGIIAGNYSLIPFGQFFFHEENDGKVSVSSTKTDTMNDFILLPVSHTFMASSKAVENQILYFFDHGRFNHHKA